VRLYPIPLNASVDLRQTIVRAAQREFQILEGVHHPGILWADKYRETERGPALIFRTIRRTPWSTPERRAPWRLVKSVLSHRGQ
jgi:hypothetical protein